MEPYNLSYLYRELSAITKDVVLYLPRTSDIRQIAEYIEDQNTVQAVHYCTNGMSRALAVYFGEWHAFHADP